MTCNKVGWKRVENQSCGGVPKTPPPGSVIHQESSRGHHIAAPEAKIYHSRRMQSEISKAKRHLGQNAEKTENTSVQESSPSAVTPDMLNSSSKGEWRPPGKPMGHSVPTAVMGAGHVGSLSAQHVAKFQAPRRKAGPGHNHIVYTNSLGTGGRPYE